MIITSTLSLIVATLLFVAAPFAAVAATGAVDPVQWTPMGVDAEGAWRLAENWDDGKVPCSNETVTIPAKTTVVIHPGTQATVKKVQLGGHLRIMKGSFGVRVYQNKTCSRLETTTRFDGGDANSGLFWLNGDNWDDNNVPCSADVTLIPKEQVVTISKTTTAETKMLKVAGRINIAGGIRIYKKGKEGCDAALDSTNDGGKVTGSKGKDSGEGDGGEANGGLEGDGDGTKGSTDTDGGGDDTDGSGGGGGGTAAAVVIVLLILIILVGGFLYKRQQDQLKEMHDAEAGGGGGALASSVGTRKAVATHVNPAFSLADGDAGGDDGDGYLDVAAEAEGRDGMNNTLYDTQPADGDGEGHYDAVPGMAIENYDALPEGGDTYEDVDGGGGGGTTETEFGGFGEENYDELPANAGHNNNNNTVSSNPADTYEDVEGYAGNDGSNNVYGGDSAMYDEMPAAAAANATYEDVSANDIHIDNTYDGGNAGVDI